MGEKRPFTLFLCVILFLYLLTGPIFLFSFDKENLIQGEKEEPQWQGVITIWDVPRTTIAGSTFGWIKARISEFEKENPGVYIELRELNYENNKEIIEKGALAQDKNKPDILPLFVEGEPIPLKNVEPLEKWISQDIIEQLRPEFIQGVTYRNKIYGMPFASSGNVLLINGDLLQSIGLNLPKNKEWTYEEFINFIEKIEKAKGKEDIITFDAYIGKGDGSIMPMLLSDGGQIYQQEEQRFAFYQPEMVSGFQKLLNVKEKATTHKKFGFREKNEVYSDFYENQKTAVLAADSKVIYTLERLKKQDKGFSYKVMPFPNGSIDIPIWYSNNLSAYAMMKGEDPEKQKVMAKFLEFLIQGETQQSLRSLGAFPVNQKVKDLYNQESLVKNWFKIGYEYQTHPLTPKWGEIEKEIIESIQAVLTGKNTPTQGCKELQMQLE